MSAATDPDFERLLEYLRDVRGFDFTGYKRPSLMRRTERRMQELGQRSFTEYQDYLEVHPEEFATLFDRILINVTEFFRDKESWDYLIAETIPRIMATRDPGTPIRVWSAGCATGEEAYSLAMAFGEVLGPDLSADAIKIYATDIDEDALATARRGTYATEALSGLPHDLVEKYFDHRGSHLVFRQNVRRWVIFGRHDLLADAPMSRLDLLVCRNTFMYFNTEAQGKVLARMHQALAPHGVLFLGHAEMLINHPEYFAPLNLKHRLFQKVPREGVAEIAVEPRGRAAAVDGDIAKVALAAIPLATVLLDAGGVVTFVNRRAQTRFGLRADDTGKLFQDIEISYKPVELRAPVAQAVADGKPVVLRHVERVSQDATVEYFDITITPLRAGRGEPFGVSITFEDTTQYHMIQVQQTRTSNDLAQANEDLMSTNEELETTNEELQSTVEELETTNEELQSTNEELETLNEEMQSTNSELQALNDELHDRSTALDSTNTTLRSILTSLSASVIVLDTNLIVSLWSANAEELWGVRSNEALGKRFMDIDFGFPVEQIADMIDACLRDEPSTGERTCPATNRRGKQIMCSVRCSPLLDQRGKTNGAVLLMEDKPAT